MADVTPCPACGKTQPSAGRALLESIPVAAHDQPGRVVDVFADVSCPFAHYSLRRFTERRKLAGARHVRLRVRAWPLELANDEPLGADKVADEIADLRAQVASDLFGGFDPEAFPTTTISILGAATLAYQHGIEVGEAFNLAIRDALFERGEAIAEPHVLAGIAAQHGVAVPDQASARAAIDTDWAEGRRRGVTGSPQFFVGGDSFFCPTLDIERQGEHLHIAIDDAELDRFLDDALR